MEKSKSSVIISLISVLFSLISLYYAYLKPQWFDSSKFEFHPIKQLTITTSFGDLELKKYFSVVNTGQKEALIDKIDCYLIPEKTYNTYYYGDVFYIYDPDYYTNDRQTRFKILTGFTLWSNNGYETDLFYVNHHDENYITSYQDIRDTLARDKKTFKDTAKTPWAPNVMDSFKISDALKTKIIEAQSQVEQILSVDTYFLCERLVTSEGKTLYQIYSFQLSDKNVNYLKKLGSEIFNQRNIQLARSVTVDLKMASQEEKNRIIKRIEEYDAKFN
ncbi:MAG TPA: hypothetical protein PLP23_04220 [Panacibacter sp.]|nr:hypothetical protein [Panacibacter sp.]